MKLLIANGANVNVKAKDIDGSTPLHRASVNGAVDVAKLLIDNGAEVNVGDEDNLMPIHLAAARGCFLLMILYSSNPVLSTLFL